MKRFVWLFVVDILVFIFGIVISMVGYQHYQRAEIVIEWSSASELDVVGYHVYRSNDNDNHGEKITPKIIPVGDDIIVGSDYSFVDADVSPGILYFYWLEEIDRNGESVRNGPIEITAEHDLGGAVLLALGLCLLIFAVSGGIWQFRFSRKKANQDMGIVSH